MGECKETQLIRFQSRVVGPPARRHSMRIINLVLCVLCIFSGILGVAYLGFDPLVRSLVLKRLVLSNTSETFHIWEDPPISPHFKVYFFNLTNPEAVFEGTEKPKLVEVGPYTYRQQWLKQNVTWHDNGTISYKTRKVFTYTPSESCESCLEQDMITTLDVPAISAYLKIQHHSWFTRYPLETVISNLHNVWMRKNVTDLLWGYDEKLFKAAQFSGDPPPFEKFGLFLDRDTSDENLLGEYSMYTGEGNPYKLATIHSYDGNTEMSFWNDSQCNKVHGSDGASFNPYIKKNDTLWFFNDQLCRAIPLVFEKDIQQEGLPGLRFVPREDVFMSPKKYPENRCYAGKDREEGDGVFDVTVCQFGAPIILSWPHFLGADQKYRDAVEGLNPEKSKHGFWFDIQDVTGTTLSAKARFQINMKVPNLEVFSDLSKVNTTVIPILWLEEGIDELGPEIVGVLKQAVIDPKEWKQIILYVWTGVFVTLLLLSTVAIARCLLNRANVSRVERVREHVEKLIIHGQTNDTNSQLITPMLDSGESSRCTTATHSRTSSEGVTPHYAVLNKVVNQNPGGIEEETLPARPNTLLPPYTDTSSLALLNSTNYSQSV